MRRRGVSQRATDHGRSEMGRLGGGSAGGEPTGAQRLDRRCKERWPASMFRKRLFDLVDELSAEFATDPPCQPTLARVACRQDDGEFSGNLGIVGDDLHAALRHVRDHTVAWQRAGPELDLRHPFAWTTFGPPPISQHFDPSSCSISADPALPKFYRTIIGRRLAEPLAMDRFCSDSLYGSVGRPSCMTVEAAASAGPAFRLVRCVVRGERRPDGDSRPAGRRAPVPSGSAER